jgi:hypothetical protein
MQHWALIAPTPLDALFKHLGQAWRIRSLCASERKPLTTELCRILAAAILGLGISGCAAPRPPLDRQAAHQAGLADFPAVRIWGDAPAEDILSFVGGSALSDKNACPPEAPTLLALSGGGEDGAFGAGYLTGWTIARNRPEFDMVTGVSTGALIAPLAFLGPEYDPQLTAAYLETGPSDVFVGRIFPFSLLSNGLANNAPLKTRIERIVSPEMVFRIAEEHAKGRRLLVATTNLDAQRPVIWDLGAIATSTDQAAAERLIEEVILASAAIPGVFPPVLIETVLPSGMRVREMHVDGATTGNIMAAPLSFIDFAGGARCPHALQLFAVVNGRLGPEFSIVPQDTLSIAERGLETVLKSFSAQALATAKALDDKGTVDLHVISIGSDFVIHRPERPFDQEYMKQLFRYGSDKSRAP